MSDIPVTTTLYRDGDKRPLYRLFSALSVAVPCPPRPYLGLNGDLPVGYPEGYVYTVEAKGMETITVSCVPEEAGWPAHQAFLKELWERES